MSIIGRLPSVTMLMRRTAASIQRFPLTTLSAAVATVAAITAVEQDGGEVVNVLAAAALGVPLGIAIVIAAEKRRWSLGLSLTLQAIGGLLLVGYYFTLPPISIEAESVAIRILLLAIGLHFLVSFAAFTGSGQMAAFWEFNKTIFLRFLMATLYATVLFHGVALALLAIDHLFGATIDSQRYMQLWIVITAFIHPLIFLSGVPDPSSVSGDVRYPVGLKIFTQFILLPLVGLYFVILIAYEAKIIVTWDWPTGWVAELVLWYAVVGILSLLLLYPLRQKTDSKWVQTFINWYFRASVPLIILLVLAIWVRIDDYGVTVNRYLVASMALGLIVVTGYFLFSRRKDIRIIPIVICILAFGAAYGPLSAFAVAERSQAGRLEAFLHEYGMLEDGELVDTEQTLPTADQQEMSNIVSYLNRYHGLDAFEPWLSDSALASLDTVSMYSRPQELTAMMGFEHVFGRPTNFFSLTTTASGRFNISGYDYLVKLSRFDVEPDREPPPSAKPVGAGEPWTAHVFDVRLQRQDAELEVWLLVDSVPAEPELVIGMDNLNRLIDAFPNRSAVSPDSLTYQGSSDRLDVRVVLSDIRGEVGEDGRPMVQAVDGVVLIRRK